ncbi:MAG: cyclic nucleotide-binding domain-containing protein, partial [Rhizobiales bacterium]|nr:cyclic nucleotide-binding domain-containing protein [Hyphomicrobiales bacterium]
MLDILSLFFGNRMDIPGHIGFLLMAVSLFLTNIFWLRVFLVLAFAFQIVYFALADTPLYTGIAYNCLFILINLFRLYSLERARRLVNAASGGDMLRKGLAGLDDEHIAELMDFGEVFELDPGAVLTEEGRPVDSFYLISDGQAVVELNGRRVGQVGAGEFVGEVAFLLDVPASATVRAATPLSVIALDSARLRGASREDPAIAGAIYRVVGVALARKLVAANRR